MSIAEVISDERHWASTVYNYRILPDAFINVTATVMPWVGFVGGACLMGNFEILRGCLEIPLNPPLEKGDFGLPPFMKEGLWTPPFSKGGLGGFLDRELHEIEFSDTL